MTGWVRSTFCAAGDCIEVRYNDPWIVLRRTDKRGFTRQLPLRVTRAEWDAFIAAVKAGDFDHLEETP